MSKKWASHLTEAVRMVMMNPRRISYQSKYDDFLQMQQRPTRVRSHGHVALSLSWHPGQGTLATEFDSSFFIFRLLDLHSNWRSISLPTITQLSTSRIDGLPRSNLLASTCQWPTLNKLLFTSWTGLIAALQSPFLCPCLRPLRLLLGME
jgi:hypothetical protein